MARESDSREQPLINRRLFLKSSAAVLGLAAMGDIVSSYTLNSPITHYDHPGTGYGTLSVAVPGFLAPNVAEQTAPLRQAWNQFGDTLLIQATGGVYDETKMAEYTATQVEKRLKTQRYGHVVMNGVSMGGNVGADALLLLNGNGTLDNRSVKASAVMLDTPASGNDLPGTFQAAALLTEYRAGRLANILPKVNGMDESLAVSQAEAMSDRAPLGADSLNFLKNLVYWESLQGGDMVQADRAIFNWQMAAGDAPFRHVEVDMEHVAFEANRELSYVAMLGIYTKL